MEGGHRQHPHQDFTGKAPVTGGHVPVEWEDFRREWVRLDTFDMYSPAHDGPQKFATVEFLAEGGWFRRYPATVTAKRHLGLAPV